MVELLDKDLLDDSDKNKDSLSLRERVRDTTQSALDKLADWRDTLTQKVEIDTTNELNELHTEIIESETTPEASRLEFESLKQEVVEQQKAIRDETSPTKTNNTDTYIPANIAVDQDPTLASTASIKKHRAEAANRVATMIKEELFDPRSWSLI